MTDFLTIKNVFVEMTGEKENLMYSEIVLLGLSIT